MNPNNAQPLSQTPEPTPPQISPEPPTPAPQPPAPISMQPTNAPVEPKNSGRKILIRIGIVLGCAVLVVIGLILAMYPNYRATQALAKDHLIFAELRELNSGVVRYVSQKYVKPTSLSEVASYANIKASSLTDAEGKAYTLDWTPQGCTSLTTCRGYTLSGDSVRDKGEKISISYNAVTGKATYVNRPGSASSK